MNTVQCSFVLVSGKKCQRKINSSDKFCWQHKKDKSTPTISRARKQVSLKSKVLEDFGHLLNHKDSHSCFDTWQQFYGYLEFITKGGGFLKPIREIVPGVAESDDDEDIAKILTDFLKPTNFFSDLKRGDMVEYLASSGYRSSGVFFVDIDGFDHKIIPMDNEPDDYGVVPSQFRVISDFPIGYWHNNLKQCSDCKSGWHNSIVWFDPSDIDLKISTQDFIYVQQEGSDIEEYYYCIIVYKNIRYCLVFISFGGDLNLVDIVERANGLLHYNLSIEILDQDSEIIPALVEKTGIPEDFMLFNGIY